MKTAKASRKRPYLADALAAALFLGGCLTNQTAKEPEELNGDGVLLSQEIDDMGNISATYALFKYPAAKKSGAVSADSASLTPFHFDAGCQCHVRSVSIKTEAGYPRRRVDSIFFRDSEDKSLRFPTAARVRSVTHKRWVRQDADGREAEIRIITGMRFSQSGSDTTGTWNGEISGTYSDDRYREGRITEVVRRLRDHRWQFPESGAAEAKGENVTLTVTFAGKDGAKVERNDKLAGKTTTVNLDSDYRPRI